MLGVRAKANGFNETSKVFVTRILGDCPQCESKNTYGNVSIHSDHVLRGCTQCSYEGFFWLPEIRKSILYLDQFFFSHAFRAKDPRFVDAADLVSKMTSSQLLVVPYSSIHEDESRMWRGNGSNDQEDLMEFIKSTSGGHEFSPDYNVEKTQIVKAFQAYLSSASTEYIVDERDAVPNDIHRWDDYFRIDVPGYFKDVELGRKLKNESIELLINAFDGWQESTSTFDEHVALEMRESAKSYIEPYVKQALRLAQGDFDAVLDSPVRANVCESLLYCLDNNLADTVKFETIKRFFYSEYFRKLPYQSISCRTFAVLKEMVARGAYANRDKAKRRLRGIFQDIGHIATYAPYCDAIVVDKPMAELVTSSRLNIESEFGVRVFSLNNWDKFYNWLNELENRITDDHRAGLEAAYV